MNNRFENLSVNALSLADDDLKHIAETAQLTEMQNIRILKQVLEKTNAVRQPKRQVHSKKRLRMLGILLAAAVAVFALGIGASGWLTYNQPLMQSFFGSIGDERLAELELPEPQTFSNGKAAATVEASLRDRFRMLVLVTFDTAEGGQKIDWLKMMQQGYADNYADEVFYYHFEVLDENGVPTWTAENPGGQIRRRSTNICRVEKNGAVTVEAELEIVDPDFDAAEIVLRYSNEALGVLDVTVPVTPCLETITLEGEDGVQMYLSPIGFRTTNIYAVHSDEQFDLRLNRSNGTQSRGHLSDLKGNVYHGEDGEYAYSEAMIHEITEGMEYQYDDPATYNGFIDIHDVVSVEWLGVLFQRTV